jgi:hypothetical protein
MQTKTNNTGPLKEESSNWPTVNIRKEFLKMFKCAYEAKSEELRKKEGIKSFSAYMNEKIFHPLIYKELSARLSIKSFKTSSVIVHDSFVKKDFEVKINFPNFYCVQDQATSCGDGYFAMNSPEVQERLGFRRG